MSPLDLAHAMAQDADVRAGTGLGRHLAIVRPPCSGSLLVSLPHRPISRCLLGIGTWQMRLFAGRQPITGIPFHPRLRWPSIYGAGLRLVPSFAAASALQLRMAAMDDLRPPSCCSTTECLGFLFHLAPICCTASSLSSFSLSSLLTRDRQR